MLLNLNNNKNKKNGNQNKNLENICFKNLPKMKNQNNFQHKREE